MAIYNYTRVYSFEWIKNYVSKSYISEFKSLNRLNLKFVILGHCTYDKNILIIKVTLSK